MGLTVSCNCTKHQIMPNHSTKSTHSIHRRELAARLHEAIRRKRVTVREMKVGKPVELHLMAEDECAICLDPLSKKNIAVTPCGHKFCFTCIAENLNVSKTCPMCRERIAPDAKKKEISLNEFQDVIYQNFEEAADIINWSSPQSPVTSDSASSDSASSDREGEPSPIPNGQLEAFGIGWDMAERLGSPLLDNASASSSSSSQSASDSDDYEGLVQEFAREHLNDLSPEDTAKKLSEFNKMLNFAINISSDIIDFYEK
jgi:hypothetical protein